MQLTTPTHPGGLLRYLGPPVLMLTGKGCPRALGLGSLSASEVCFPSETLEGSLCVLSLLCEGHPRYWVADPGPPMRTWAPRVMSNLSSSHSQLCTTDRNPVAVCLPPPCQPVQVLHSLCREVKAESSLNGLHFPF